MIRILILFLVLIFPFLAHAQGFSIKLDLSNAEKTLQLLQAENPDAEDFDELLALPSTQALIRKLESKDSTLISAMLKSKNRESLATRETYYQYDRILNELDSNIVFVEYLQARQEVVENEFNESLGIYIPSDKKMEVEIIGIMGGHSTGYTFGDPDKFYISLHHMKNDPEYLLAICKHELFHNIQALLFDGESVRNSLGGENDYNADFSTYLLFEALFNEGTATYLDDWENAERTPANSGFIDRTTASRRRMKSNFYIFENLVTALQDTAGEESINYAYNIFFTLQYDEAGYYMGKEMTRFILEKSGRDLSYYLSRSPLTFLSDYMALSKEYDDAPYVFSDKFERIAQTLSKKIAK